MAYDITIMVLGSRLIIADDRKDELHSEIALLRGDMNGDPPKMVLGAVEERLPRKQEGDYMDGVPFWPLSGFAGGTLNCSLAFKEKWKRYICREMVSPEGFEPSTH